MRNLFTYFRGLIPLIALLFMLPATVWGAEKTHLMKSYSSTNNVYTATDDQSVEWSLSSKCSSSNQLPATWATSGSSSRGICFATPSDVTVTSQTTFNNITKIVIDASSNMTNSNGTISLKIGTTDFGSKNLTKTNHQTLEFTSNTPVSGVITLTVKQTSNSVWIGGLKITTSDKTLNSISVTTAPKSIYTEGDNFDPSDLKITAAYSTGNETITYSGHESEFTFNPSLTAALTTANKSVSITWGGKTCTHPITVNAAVVDDRIAVNLSTFTTAENATTMIKGGSLATSITNDQDGWTAAYTYGTSDDQVATIDENGVITAVGSGNARITAYLNVADDDANYKVGNINSKYVDITVNVLAQFSINGSINNANDQKALAGTDISFPTDPEVDGVKFMGWMKGIGISGTQETAPTMVDKSAEKMGTDNVTYYAVFAVVEEGSGAETLTKITAVSQMTAGTYAIIKDEAYYLKNINYPSTPTVTAVTKTNGVISISDDMKWNVTGNNTDGFVFTSPLKDSNGKDMYLFGSTSNSGVRVVNSYTASNAQKLWYVKSDNTYGVVLYNKTDTKGDRYLCVYIASGGINQDWRNYTSMSASQYPANIYKIGAGTNYSDYCTTVSLDPQPTIVLSATELAEYAGNTNNSITVSVSEQAYTGTLEVSSDNEVVATASISDGRVVINALAAGTATITITAPAVEGSWRKATATIAVTVNAKLAHDLLFNAETLTLTVGDTEFSEPTLSNPNNLPVVYSLVYAKDENAGKVATIDPATGKITLANPSLSTETQGAVTVKASTVGDNSHAAGEVTYNLVVARKVSTTSWKKDGEVVSTITIDQDELALLPSATNDANCNIQYESSNTEVASFADNKKADLTFVDYGTTVITAKTSATREYAATSATYTLTFAPRYTVSFKYTDDTKAAEDIREETTGAGVTLPNVKVADGKLFKGWSTENPATSADAGVASATYKPTANTPLYAYIVDVYAVTFNGTVEHGSFEVKNGATTITSGDKIEVGTELTVVCTNDEHYHVASVAYNGTAIPYDNNKYSFIVPAEAVEVSVVFVEDEKFEVSWVVNGFEAKKENLYADVRVSAPAVSAQGNKEFMGWVESPIAEATDTKPDMVDVSNLTVNEPKTFYAVFATQTGEESEVTEEFATTEIEGTLSYTGSAVSFTDGDINYSIRGHRDNKDYPWIQLKKDVGTYVKITAPSAIKKVVVAITSASNSSGGVSDITKHTDYSGTVALCAADCNYTTSSASVASTSSITNDIATLTTTGNNSELYLKVSTGARFWNLAVTYGTPATYSAYCTSITDCDIALTTSGDYGFSTFCGSANYTVEGAKAYKASVVSGDLVLTELTGIIPAGNDNYENGVVIAGTPGETATIRYTTEVATADMSGNQLLGTLAMTPTETLKNGADYLMVFSKSNGGFVSYTGTSVPAYKACLPYSDNAGAPMRMVFGRDNLPTNNVNVNVNDNLGTKVMIDGRLYILRDGKTYDSFGRLVK